MAEVTTTIASGLMQGYNAFIGLLPSWAQGFINFFLLVLLVVIYAIFVWNLYKVMSRKNIFGLNLNKYNKYQDSFFEKIVTGIFFLIEYIIILPFFVFLVFVGFSLFLILLAQPANINQVLIISAIIIMAVRMTAYYKEELSTDLAKLLPFSLLAVAVLNPVTFSQAQYFAQIINLLKQIPTVISSVAHYLIFIIVIEIILRFFDFIFSLFGLEEIDETQEEEKD